MYVRRNTDTINTEKSSAQIRDGTCPACNLNIRLKINKSEEKVYSLAGSGRILTQNRGSIAGFWTLHGNHGYA